jgi:acyl-CoA synthetase (NDP forming)
MHLSRLLQPRSIAVLGGVWAENVVIQCKKMGYSGAIFPVHPRRKKMAGVACYHRLINLPEPPDAVFLGINRDAAVTAVAELSAMGAGGVICFASGFAEIGGGILQSKLVAAAADMPLLGPNCYGMVNFLDGVPIWPDQHGGRRTTRGVAIIGQSSNILINLSSQRRGLPIAYLVAAGNQAQCNVTDIARSVMEDKRVSAVGLHLESIDNAADFAAMAALAVQKKVALVALKVGKCHAAQRATASHTAALASEKETSSAFLRRCGIAETDTIGVFMETLKLLHVHGSLAGGRLVSMSCSGGEAAHVADLAATRKLYFSPFSVRQKRALKKTLGERVHIANPLEYHAFTPIISNSKLARVYRRIQP